MILVVILLTTFPKKTVLPAARVQVRPRNLMNMLVRDEYGDNSKPASMLLTSGTPEPKDKKKMLLKRYWGTFSTSSFKSSIRVVIPVQLLAEKRSGGV